MQMFDHLECGSYRIIDNNLSEKVMKDVSKIIKNSSLDDSTKKKLIPRNGILPPIYGLLKIHKSGVPIRPSVNTIGHWPIFLPSF